MQRRPDPHPEHAGYRARVIEADRAATRIVEGLRRREPWALRLAAWMEERTGERCPECHCDECDPLQGATVTISATPVATNTTASSTTSATQPTQPTGFPPRNGHS